MEPRGPPATTMPWPRRCQFHEQIVRIAGNATLHRVWRSLGAVLAHDLTDAGRPGRRPRWTAGLQPAQCSTPSGSATPTSCRGPASALRRGRREARHDWSAGAGTSPRDSEAARRGRDATRPGRLAGPCRRPTGEAAGNDPQCRSIRPGEDRLDLLGHPYGRQAVDVEQGVVRPGRTCTSRSRSGRRGSAVLGQRLATIPPRPPMIVCSSTVIARPVRSAPATIPSTSTGLRVGTWTTWAVDPVGRQQLGRVDGPRRLRTRREDGHVAALAHHHATCRARSGTSRRTGAGSRRGRAGRSRAAVAAAQRRTAAASTSSAGRPRPCPHRPHDRQVGRR